MKRFAPPLVGAAMLLLTWMGWCDPVVDFGRELYIPWRLLEGEVLYRDIAYLHGPFSPTFNAFIFSILGVSLRSLLISNALILLAITVLFHRRIKCAFGEFEADAVTVLFFVLFAFSQYIGIANFNFMTPYSHEMTHGLLLSLLSFELVERKYFVGGGIILGLVFLTKAELFVAAGAAHAAYSFKDWRAFSRGAIGLSGVFALAWLVFGSGALGTWRGVFHENVATAYFYRRSLAQEGLWGNLTALFFWTAVWGSSIALSLSKKEGLWGLGVIPISLALWGFDPLMAVRPLPLAIIAVAWWKRQEIASDPGLRLLFVWAALLLLKMHLDVRLFQYGFVLAMPAFLVCSAAWISVPRARAGALAVLFVFSYVHLKITHYRYSVKSHVVGSGADSFRTDKRGVLVGQVAAKLALMPPSTTVSVWPEGMMMNFLSRRKNPMRVLHYLPPELVFEGDQRLRAGFDSHPPDVVVLVHRDTSEFGFPFFGVDYGRWILERVRKDYRSVGRAGDPVLKEGSRFGVELLVANR